MIFDCFSKDERKNHFLYLLIFWLEFFNIKKQGFEWIEHLYNLTIITLFMINIYVIIEYNKYILVKMQILLIK